MRQWLAVTFFEQNTYWQMEWVVAFSFEPIEQFLDSRLMSDGRTGIWLCRRRLGRVFPTQAVNAIEFFGSLVIRLERVVLQRPCGGNAVGMPDLIEVSLPEPQEDSAIDLAVAADKIMQPRMKGLAIRTVPSLLCLIARIYEYGLAVPILAFSRQIATALEEEDALPGLRQAPRHGAATRTGADNDHIVMFAGAHCN